MKKTIHIIFKLVLTLILLFSVLGIFGVFPPPTRELYNTDMAFEFISILTDTGYINYMMAIVNVLAIIALWSRKEALAAILLTPITANIIGFHAFLDGGLFTAGAIMANVLLLLNLYFLWKNCDSYRGILAKK